LSRASQAPVTAQPAVYERLESPRPSPHAKMSRHKTTPFPHGHAAYRSTSPVSTSPQEPRLASTTSHSHHRASPNPNVRLHAQILLHVRIPILSHLPVSYVLNGCCTGVGARSSWVKRRALSRIYACLRGYLGSTKIGRNRRHSSMPLRSRLGCVVSSFRRNGRGTERSAG
jgi:hypothetical protein